MRDDSSREIFNGMLWLILEGGDERCLLCLVITTPVFMFCALCVVKCQE